MKMMKSLTAVALVATLAATPSLAQESQDVDAAEADNAEVVEPTVNFSAAVATAEAKAQGKLVSLELEYFEDAPFYAAVLVGETSVSMLLIDAVSGEVLASNVTEAANEEVLALLLEDDDYEEEDDMDDDDDHDMGVDEEREQEE